MKRPASPTICTRSDVRVFVTAAVIAALLFLCAPPAKPALAQESTQQMPAGIEVGEDGASIGDELFAGDGCARIGELEAGDCGKREAGGEGADGAAGAGEDAGGASDEQYGAEGGASDEQYGAEGGSEGEAGDAAVLESTTSGDGGSGSGGGESTRSQTVESTTGVVEEGSDDAAGEDTGGESGPQDAEQGAPEAASTDRGCAAEGPMGETTTTTVERIIDGDTVETPEGTVRLIGVDTPETVDPGEPVEPGGEEASEFTASELEGEPVELEPGTEPEDDYGRGLAYVWTEDESGEPVLFNEVLLREGLAELLIIPPNDEYERCLAAAEEAARDEGVGLWADDAGEEQQPPEDSPPGPEIPVGDSAEETDTPPVTATTDAPTDAPTQDQYDAEEAQPEPVEPEIQEPSAAEDQYEGAASEPAPPAPTDEPEIQEPEIQDPEVQQEEIQEPEIRAEAREPRVRSSELAGAPAEIPVEDSTELPDDTSVPPSSVPAAPAGAAPITTLPETGGASAVSLAAGTLLVCSGLLAARLARTPHAARNATAHATAHERNRN